MDNEEVTLTMISSDGKDKIVCYKFMEECFRKEGYKKAKKVSINLLYEIFNLGILRKIKVFFTLCLRCKFIFKDPEHYDFLIFDKEASSFIEQILPSKNYAIIPTRIHEINKVYLSKEIIF